VCVCVHVSVHVCMCVCVCVCVCSTHKFINIQRYVHNIIYTYMCIQGCALSSGHGTVYLQATVGEGCMSTAVVGYHIVAVSGINYSSMQTHIQ
jgi:hypothetical protein